MKIYKIPTTRKTSIAWHRYMIELAAECRITGYKQEAAKYLSDAAIARLNIKYFTPDNNMPF